MKTVRCKMVCRQYEANDTAQVDFEVVVADENNEENSKFFKYTPGGGLSLSVVNPDVKFEEGKEYYIDITEASHS